MPTQPPRGHLPAYIAPLYVLARALHEVFPAEGLPTFDLKPFTAGPYMRPTAAATYAGERRSFSVTVSGFKPSRIGVELYLELVLRPRIVPRFLPPQLPQSSEPTNAPPTAPAAVEEQLLAFEDDEDDEWPDWPEPTPEEAAAAAAEAAERAEADERRVKRVAVTLVPPFETCLLSEHLSATARWRGLAGLPTTAHGGRTFPADAYFSFPHVAAALGKELRDVLAGGGGRAVLMEPTGDETPVPARFWRSEAAEAVLAGEVNTVVPLDGREATGAVWFDEVALDAAWRQLRGTAAASVKPTRPAEKKSEEAPARRRREPPHTAVPQPTAWMVFMQEIALEFGYSGGRPVGPHRFTKEQLAAQLRTRWPDELGEWSQNYAESLAAFILHPSNRKLGNADNTTKAEKERTQAMLQAEKEKIAGKKTRR